MLSHTYGCRNFEIILLILLVFWPSYLSPQQEEYRLGKMGWQFGRVIDGDTFTIIMPALPSEISELSIRVRGIDAPEIGSKARCPWEALQANRAKEFTKTFLASGEIILSHLSWDKYGGRLLADVWVKNRCRSLAQALIEANLAKTYQGKRRPNWCRG